MAGAVLAIANTAPAFVCPGAHCSDRTGLAPAADLHAVRLALNLAQRPDGAHQVGPLAHRDEVAPGLHHGHNRAGDGRAVQRRAAPHLVAPPAAHLVPGQLDLVRADLRGAEAEQAGTAAGARAASTAADADASTRAARHGAAPR